MRTTRIYSPLPLTEGETVAATPEAINHLVRVLRAQVGDELSLFDGRGNEFSASIASIAVKSVTMKVGPRIANDTESPLRVSLIQGVSRGERMDLVVQKATELGVATIIPVITARSVVKLDRDQAAKRREHWLTIAINACEQCGRATLPTIAEPLSLATLLRKGIGESPQWRYVLDPQAHTSLATEQAGTSLECQLLIGPEGGLSEEEIAAAEAAGFLRVKVGPRVLRTETAAIAALAVLQGVFGDLR